MGQSLLVEAYERSLWSYGHHAAQVLLTAEDLDHRIRYLNARNTLLTLMDLGAVPIINENDTVSVEELQTTFGDNDRLAAIVTNLVQAPLLVLLSDVDGLFTAHPNDPSSRMLTTVERIDDSIRGMIRDRTGGLSKGGMASKINAARIVTTAGGSTIIASGRNPQVLSQILAGEPVGTLFISAGANDRGQKTMDRLHGATAWPPGARRGRAAGRGTRWPQPVGPSAWSMRWDVSRKGDVVALRDREGVEFARGLTNYNSDEVRRIKGLRTQDIAATLGHCPYDEIVHRDNMAVTT